MAAYAYFLIALLAGGAKPSREPAADWTVAGASKPTVAGHRTPGLQTVIALPGLWLAAPLKVTIAPFRLVTV